MRAGVIGLSLLLATFAAGCSSSSDDADVSADDAIAAARVEPSDDAAAEGPADELPDGWACARRNVFTPVGQSPDMQLVDPGDVHSEPSAEAFAEAHVQYVEGFDRWVAAEKDDQSATFVYANADDEAIDELVVTRQDDGSWIEAQDTVCA